MMNNNGVNIWRTRTVENCNDLFTLPDSDTDSSSDSECKLNHCTKKSFSHFTESDSDSNANRQPQEWNWNQDQNRNLDLGMSICHN